jgi:GAF domain-containing protein/HAMP domain-containing protein
MTSIRTRLILALVGLAIVPLLLVGLVLGWRSFQVQRQQALTLQRQVAQRITTAVAAFFNGLETELRAVTEVQGLADLPPDQQENVLLKLLLHGDVFQEVILLDAQGREQIYYSRLKVVTPADLRDRSQQEEFLAPMASGETYYSPVRFDEQTGEPLMTIAVPLLNPRSGQADGVLVAEVRIKPVWNLIAGFPVGEGESVYIVDAQDRVIAHRNPSVVLRGTTFVVPSQDGVYTGLDGTTVVLATDQVHLGEQVFTVIAERSVLEALNLAIVTIIIIAGLIMIALVAAIALGIVAVHQIVHPLEVLAVSAQAIEAGDLSQHFEVGRRDEIGVLGEAFNRMTDQLREFISNLEQQVAGRTHDLAQRSAYLEASAEVGRAASSILDADDLVHRVVDLIRERFGLYYVGLFLVDPTREWAVLRAGSGQAGQMLLGRGHRLRIAGESMVGWSIVNAQARVAQVAEEDAVRLATPELPDTRAEAALPLRSRGQVVGALSVQSRQPGIFDRHVITVLQTMADQVAVALDNARLFTEAEKSLEAERRAYGQLNRAAWLELLRTQPDLGFMSHAQGTVPAGDLWRPEMKAALQADYTVMDEESGRRLAIPLRVAGQVIGVVDGRKPDGSGNWTAEEIGLLEALADQLSVALEGARLYQDTQRRAAREQLVGQVTARMRESLDVDMVLKTAVREMRDALGIAEVEVHLTSEGM